MVTENSMFGKDPLISDSQKRESRRRAFEAWYPSFQVIFSEMVSGKDSTFKETLLFYVNLTYRLSLSQ